MNNLKHALILITALTLNGCGAPSSAPADAGTPRNAGPTPIASFSTTGEQMGTSTLTPATFTIAGHVTLTNTTPAHMRIFEQGGAYNGGGVDIETNATGDSVSCLLWDATGGFYQGATALIPLNTRTHVACSYDGSKVRLYIDGALADAETGLSYIAPTTNMFVGKAAHASSGNRDFIGTLETISVYGEALSDVQIFDLSEE